MVRLDDDVRERLESLSRKEDLSLNHVMNSGLREYAEWGAVYQNAGLAVTGEKRRHIWSSPGSEISTSKMSSASSEASSPDTAAHSSSNIHRRAGSTQLS